MSAHGDHRPLTFAVVGLGYWGPHPLRVLRAEANAAVRWVCALDVSRLERYARQYPGVRTTRDIDDVLADDGVDAVLIATPVFSHVALCTRSLSAGKHTFVEKPLATSTAKADALLRLARAHDRV